MRRFTLNLAGVILLTCVGQASAGTLTFNLSNEYTGGDPPEGATPWLVATFDDHDASGSVDLTLEAINLTDSEFVGEWLFNLDSALDPTALSFSTMTVSGLFAAPTINTGVDTYPAAGDGMFDLQFVFSNAGDSSAKFGVGYKLKTTITGIAGLDVSSFDAGSAPVGESTSSLSMNG